MIHACQLCRQSRPSGSEVPGLNIFINDSLKVLFNSSKVKFDFAADKISVKDVEKAITNLGYEVIKSQVNHAVRLNCRGGL
jgi:copper chaperone